MSFEHEEAGRYFGKYMGYVRDVNDPDDRGRLRLFCPEVMGEIDNADHWTNWALPNFPWFAQAGIGVNLLPEVSGPWAVWVEFRHGDVRFPIWTGVFPLEPTRVNEAAMVLGATLMKWGSADADEPFTLGNALTTILVTVLTSLATHTHSSSGAGPPNDAGVYEGAKTQLELGAIISDFIFGQKSPP